MFKLYTEKDVLTLVTRIKEEYRRALAAHTEAEESLKEENRQLRARLSVLEGERSGAISAFAAAERERTRARTEAEGALEAERRELRLLAGKCRLMLDRLSAKYPDAEDVAALRAFTAELGAAREEEEEPFDLEAVTSPKQPLDLEKLCRELGLMEDTDET